MFMVKGGNGGVVLIDNRHWEGGLDLNFCGTV